MIFSVRPSSCPAFADTRRWNPIVCMKPWSRERFRSTCPRNRVDARTNGGKRSDPIRSLDFPRGLGRPTFCRCSRRSPRRWRSIVRSVRRGGPRRRRSFVVGSPNAFGSSCFWSFLSFLSFLFSFPFQLLRQQHSNPGHRVRPLLVRGLLPDLSP